MRGRLPRLLGLIALALAPVGSGVEAAGAYPLNTGVANLMPGPGYASWTSTNQFRITWDLVHSPGGGDPTGFGYRFRDPSGRPIGPEHHSDEPALTSVTASIPRAPGETAVAPGRYGFELWLESGDEDGTAAATTLRFDDARPDPARLLAPEGWVRAGNSVEVKVERPTGPTPPSGIGGYAVGLDHGSGTGPCGGRDRCDGTEVNLADGAGGTVSLGPLAEELNIARVVAVSGTGISSAPSEAVELRVDGTPPRIALDGVPRGWTGGPVTIVATARDEGSGMSPDGPVGPLTAIAVDGSVATVAPGDSATTVVHDEGVHEVGAYARDAVGNFSDGGGASDPPPLAQVRIDETSPRVGFAVAQDPAEPERVVAVVEDALAGADPERGSIAVRLAGSSRPFEPIPTSVVSGRMTAVWNSDSYPPGSYEFRATAYDLAGNRATTELRTDGRLMALANPLKTPTAIAFGFGGRQLVWHRCRRSAGELHCHRQLIGPFEARPDSRSIPYGRGVPVGGRLTDAAGLPLAGQLVRVTELFGAGATPTERQTTVVTAADGVFLAHLPPGPSRRIEVGFGGSPVLTRTGGRALELGVKAAVKLRASTATATIGGAPVLFTGVIAHEGAAIPATGLPIELQFRLPGLPWSEFRTVQTGPGGRFRYAYAFSDDDSRGVHFQFRARLTAQPGWPFDPGISRPIAVTGR